MSAIPTSSSILEKPFLIAKIFTGASHDSRKILPQVQECQGLRLLRIKKLRFVSAEIDGKMRLYLGGGPPCEKLH